MSLPNYRLAAQQPQTQSLTAGSPVSFNILKERLRANPSGGSSMGGFFFQGVRQDEVKSNPFTQNQYGNNAFNPQRITGKAMPGHGAPKPPKAPEKPLAPFNRYSKKVWDSVTASNKEMQLWEVGKVVGVMWKELPESEKQEFIEEYETEKAEYDKAMALYKTSPAYQTYIQAKARGNPIIDDPEPRGVKIAERRIDIQPAEDEEDPDDGLSVKHVSHARFLRNHRLINEIFSDAMVPDVRSVVNTSRMQVLKRQVHSLTMHQKKLETELTHIEDKYNQKKRKFLESSEEFQSELKKHCVKAVDEDRYKEMVKEQVEKLKQEREDRARAGAPTPPSPAAPNDLPSDNRHVLQPVDKSENPDTDAGSDKAKEGGDNKDENMDTSDGAAEKVADVAAKNDAAAAPPTSGAATAVATPVANAGPPPTSAASSDPPLQYATMANQKPPASVPAQMTAPAVPAPQPVSAAPAPAPAAPVTPAGDGLAAATPAAPVAAPAVPPAAAGQPMPASGAPPAAGPGAPPAAANPAAPAPAAGQQTAPGAPPTTAPSATESTQGPPNVTAPTNYGPPPGAGQGPPPPGYPPQQYPPQGGYPGYPAQPGYRPPHPQQGGYPPYGGYPPPPQQHEQGYPPNPYPPQQQAMPPTPGAPAVQPPPVGAVPAPMPQTQQPVPPPAAGAPAAAAVPPAPAAVAAPPAEGAPPAQPPPTQ